MISPNNKKVFLPKPTGSHTSRSQNKLNNDFLSPISSKGEALSQFVSSDLNFSLSKSSDEKILLSIKELSDKCDSELTFGTTKAT